ncbi:MAG: penicillin-binding protein 2 [Marinilabiliaceae bacterium]|jgi:penicillin-binding protein 2|nr:penicillin-binding protein 2 [Marinilabiliaceae bacterium]
MAESIDRNTNRKFFFIVIILLAGLVLLIKLFVIQVLDKSYRLSAENNVLRYVTQYPARGLIYDRNGELLVYNQAAYDLMVIPGQVEEFDTLELCSIIDITIESFNERLGKAISFSRQAPSVFLKMVSSETYARLQETLYRYPGFYVQTRTLRKYTHSSASHVLGYVSEVDEGDLAEDSYYKMGDYIGKSGIEESYEKELRGRKGLKIFLVDVHSRIKGAYQGGRYDSIPLPGKDITLSLDIGLQLYGEKLLEGKRGSIVALEPETGEVLALVSAPGYDPSLLVGRIRSENFRALQNDTLKPLFNRALMAFYPPGSTFKPVNGIIALNEGVITPRTEFFCDNGYWAPGIHVGCHHFESFSLSTAIMASCNAYFCNAFRKTLENPKYGSTREAFNAWRDYLLEFGFGSKLGIDFSNELNGNVPEPGYYDRYYGEGRWKALTVLSLAIGQGELETTPLQMANMTAAIANRGYYYTPHIVKSIGGSAGNPDPRFGEVHRISIDSASFEPIVEGMRLVVNAGPGQGATATWVKLKDIEVCGKTGTAENPHGEDHSIFVAFAPADDPKIALAVYVENSGFGSTYAAPTAVLLIEKYLKGKISNKWLEDYILKEPEIVATEN